MNRPLLETLNWRTPAKLMCKVRQEARETYARLDEPLIDQLEREVAETNQTNPLKYSPYRINNAQIADMMRSTGMSFR